MILVILHLFGQMKFAAFYQKRAKADEFQNCKIMKASIIETRTRSIVIEDADDD